MWSSDLRGQYRKVSLKKEMIPQIVSQANPEKYKNRGYTMYEMVKK